MDDFEKRFRAKYVVDNESGCWVWTASLAGRGYGQIKIPGTRKQDYAHRVAYRLFVGQIPDGLNVLHRCDNPRCVNPQHLFTGTKGDNSQDMKSKGRHLYGERNTEHVLFETDVRAIKALLAAGLPQKYIAEKFGVHQMTISRINQKKRWAHVT